MTEPQLNAIIGVCLVVIAVDIWFILYCMYNYVQLRLQKSTFYNWEERGI